MTFLYPIFIYLMLPVTLILFYFLMRNAGQDYAMFDANVLEKLQQGAKGLRRRTRYLLFLLTFIGMIIALAQPVIKEGEVVVEAKSADILVGIDISDSMRAEDRYPNRLDFAKAKATELIKQAPHNRIGVLAFAKHDYIVSPLSFDHGSVAFLLSKVQTGNITEKGTRLKSMLRSAISMLEHAKEKNLLLFTDGGDKEDFSEEIALANENNLRLFIMGIGTSKGSPVKNPDGSFVKHKGNILISKLNTDIKNLATKTGGVYIESVLGNKDIETMLKEIESMTQKASMKQETIPQYTQLFYYPLAVSALFLLLAFSSLPKRAAALVAAAFIMAMVPQEAKAGLLDFKKLSDAKEAYAQEDYKKSISLYEGFAISSSEAEYNLANSLYKDKEYERALKIYDRISTQDKELEAKVLHNKANAQVKLEQYEEALKSYEEALKIKEDQETKENYEAVKKFLEQKKKEQEQQQNEDNKQEDDQNNSSQDQETQQDPKQKRDNQQEDSQENKNSDQNDSQNKEQDQKDSESEQEQKSDNSHQEKDDAQEDQQKSEAKSEEDTSDEQDQNRSSQMNDEQQTEEEKEEVSQSQPNVSEEKNEQMQEEQKEENIEQKSEQNSQEAKASSVQMKQMSDLEAKKWLKAVKRAQKGHLYRMQAPREDEDENEKPW